MPTKTAEFVIPLKPDDTISNTLRIKHTKGTVQADNEATKETIHVAKLAENATPYQILDFFREF